MERSQRLKAKLFEMDDHAIFLSRMEILKESANRYRDETAGIKFGHTLQAMLSRIDVVIDDDDLIVGRCPEVVLNAEQEGWFREHSSEFFYVPWFWTSGHLTLSWERLLNEGLIGIRQRAQAHLDRLTGEDGASLSKRDFLRGALLCCDAIAHYAERYADAAQALAGETPVGKRKQELLQIAEVCRRVPEHPASTLHEAVQSMWLVDLILHTVVGARDFTPGRMDQYLYPFYERDLAAGRTSPDAALELIESFYIKCSEIIGLADQANARKLSLCQDSVQYVVLGGQTADGGDATNPLSFICLQAGYLLLKQPTIKVRYFEGIDEAFWLEACRLARAGGAIGFYNDAVEIPAFLSVGVDLEDARGYSHYGCCNANVPGKEGSLLERWHSVPKFLELVLNNGFDPVKGEQVGPQTGDADTFDSIDDLMGALQIQIRHAMEAERGKYPPLPEADDRYSFTLESIFLEDCIENGREWRLGGTKYCHKTQHASGIATAVDSLAAIRSVVFEAGDLTLSEFRDILSADFEGHEPLRQRLRNRCPKYGNDDDGVDALARQLAEMFCDEVVRCNEVPHSVRFWPEIYSYHNNKDLGAKLGATPDGRKRGESISENQSPTYGMDMQGVTSCLKSMAKLPFHRTPGGGTNLKLHPASVQGESGLACLGDLMKTYFELGGQHLQLNIIDAAILKQAQQNPEDFRTLSVRVVGYSAYFTTLSKRVQDDLIARTEHSI
jgi:formate C-acetyltransferase